MNQKHGFCPYLICCFLGVAAMAACGSDGGDDWPTHLSGVEIELPDGSELETPGEMITFTNDRGETLTGVLVIPESDSPLPVVMVLHGAGGLFTYPDSNDTKYELPTQFSEWAALLSRRGYAVFFPSSYYSRGFFEWDDRPDDLGLDLVDRLIFRVYDAYAAMDYACTRPELDCNRVAALGFSNGASAAALIQHENLDTVYGMEALKPASERHPFAFSIAYYPGCGFNDLISLNMDNPEEYFFPSAPLWIEHGDEDSLVDNCHTREMQAEEIVQLRNYDSNPLTLTVYSGAGHGFDSSPDNSTEEKTRDTARAETLGLIDSNL